MKHNDSLTGSLCALGCELLFGFSYLFTRQATQSAGAFALLGWRFLVAAAIMGLCILAGAIKIHLRGKPIGPLLLVAVFNPCLYFLGETLGIRETTASESGVFLACIPVFSLAASALFLRKKPSALQIFGILMTLAGVVLTVLAVGAASSLSVPGYAFLLLAVLSYALNSVLVEKATAYTGAEITFLMLVAGAVVFGALAVWEAAAGAGVGALLRLPFGNPAFLAAILYQGIGCSILAFFLSNMAISKIGVNRSASFIGVSTVVSILAGALLLQETFGALQIVGAIVIVAGVYTANAGNPR